MYSFIEITEEEQEKMPWCAFFCNTCGLRSFGCGKCNHCHPDPKDNSLNPYCKGCDRDLCCEHDESCIEDFEDHPENYYNEIVKKIRGVK